jgi:ribosome maturation factor RimP
VSDRGIGLGAVEAVIGPLVAARGLTLVDLGWGRQGRRPILRLYVDRPGGVTVGECEGLSREAGDVLDVERLIDGPYDLEVSSPGLDRELHKDREFAWAVGKEIRVWLREPEAGRTELTGRLAAVTPDRLVLVATEGDVTVERGLVSKARLEPPRPGQRSTKGS